METGLLYYLFGTQAFRATPTLMRAGSEKSIAGVMSFGNSVTNKCTRPKGLQEMAGDEVEEHGSI